MRKINSIVIHHSASDFGDAETIRRWHVDGRGWSDIGYHFVILNGVIEHGGKYESVYDGFIERGRHISRAGAHVKGYNSDSIGVCLIGTNQHEYTSRQLVSITNLLKDLLNVYPNVKIYGHKELDEKKPLCPDLDMDRIRKILGVKNDQNFSW